MSAQRLVEPDHNPKTNTAWQAHVLAVELVDDNPNAITHELREAATKHWCSLFLGGDHEQ